MSRARSDGVIRKFTIRADVFRSLLMRRVITRASTIPLMAIIALPVAVARTGRFRGKTVELGDIEALNFAEIVTPIGEAGFDAVQNCGVKRENGIPMILGR